MLGLLMLILRCVRQRASHLCGGLSWSACYRADAAPLFAASRWYVICTRYKMYFNKFSYMQYVRIGCIPLYLVVFSPIYARTPFPRPLL